MRYKLIKWLILIIPTLTIGLWEYVRHEFLLPYISMELGNVLAPVIVFVVTMLFLTQLFHMMEQSRKELEEAKAMKAVLQERETIAKELHDGIAQSIFLLSVQIERIEQSGDLRPEIVQQLKETVRDTNTYVRQAIANLREPAAPAEIPWLQGLYSFIQEIEQESDLRFTWDWHIAEECLTAKEKVELPAIMREALFNIYKHAEAAHARITGTMTADGGWVCEIADDGKGFKEEEVERQDKYGITIMRERARRMNWQLDIARTGKGTIVRIKKGGAPQ